MMVKHETAEALKQDYAATISALEEAVAAESAMLRTLEPVSKEAGDATRAAERYLRALQYLDVDVSELKGRHDIAVAARG